MAYQTGTATSPTNLKAIIESFATTNGWTLSGSDYLYKGLSFVKLTVPAGPSTTKLQINAANSSDGLTTPFAYTPYIYIAAVDWPITYYLFVQTNPDIIVCVLHYNTNLIQPIIFGDIVKIHNSAYVGGNFIFAPKYDASHETQVNSIFNITDNALTSISTVRYSSGITVPFSAVGAVSETANRNSPIHAEIDGKTWVVASLYATPSAGTVLISNETTSAYYRSPNIWNSQSQLIPIKLIFGALDSFVMYLGYIEHLRFVRVDNYEIGDIITIGSDKWKVFPWSKKDATYRNGPGNSVSGSPNSSGTLGFAVRYDGP